MDSWDEFETGASGNFLAVKLTADAGATLEMRMKKQDGTWTDWLTDADGEFIWHMNQPKACEVRGSLGTKTETKSYEIALTYEED